jgi:Na+/proline symporter
MRSKYAATVLLSIGVFIVVTLFVTLVVLWWTGEGTRGVRLGVICGAVAVVILSAVSWARRSGERAGDEHQRSRGGRNR